MVGALTQAAVAGLLLAVGAGSLGWLLVVVTLTAGLPLGLIGLANKNAVYVQADPARTASSAGLLRTFTYLGAIVAMPVIGLAFPSRADTAGLHTLALVMLGLAVVLLVLTPADRGLRRVGSGDARHGRRPRWTRRIRARRRASVDSQG
ncbi:hypothetical protein [Blastococcus sp. SYSU DS0616]